MHGEKKTNFVLGRLEGGAAKAEQKPLNQNLAERGNYLEIFSFFVGTNLNFRTFLRWLSIRGNSF